MFEQLDLFLESAREEESTTKITEEDLQKRFEKKLKVRPLQPHEWELYRLIKYNSEVEHRKTTKREICDKIDFFKWNDDPKAHDNCSAIWTAIKNNNESFEHEKIIITHENQYWIGCEEETKIFIEKLWSDLMPRLVRYWKYLKKSKEDGQGRLLDKYNNVIDEESVRSFVEGYIK